MKDKNESYWNGEQVSYWQSYSDMMAALLIIFILIIAITMAIYKQKNIELENATISLNQTRDALIDSRNDLDSANEHVAMTEEELADAYSQLEAAQREIDSQKAQLEVTRAQLDAAKVEIDNANEELRSTKSQLKDIVGIRTDIIGQLQTKFNNSQMKVDAQTGSIVFSSDVLFKKGSADLSDESKNLLKEVIPTYLSVLMKDEFRNYVAEIIVEGHTDTEGGYEYNMDLSYKRANAVAMYCLNAENGLNSNQIEQLRHVLTVNGRSYMNPIKKDGSNDIDMAASRRVEIKFRLKEDEMIGKITEVLEKDEQGE